MASSDKPCSTLNLEHSGLHPADLHAISEWASGIEQIKEVWLYGSRARGAHRADSDIDLAIVTTGSSEQERYSAYLLYRHCWPEPAVAHPVDLNWYDPEAADLEYVGPGVRRDGIRLYSRLE